MSTRSSIWLGESQGKSVHIYWELAEREDGDRIRAPIYIAVLPHASLPNIVSPSGAEAHQEADRNCSAT